MQREQRRRRRVKHAADQQSIVERCATGGRESRKRMESRGLTASKQTAGHGDQTGWRRRLALSSAPLFPAPLFS